MEQELLSRLRTLVAFELESYEGRLRSLSSSQYPSDVALRLIQHIAAEIRAQRTEIDQLVRDFRDDPERVARGLSSQHRLLINRLAYLSSLENAQTEAVPWSLVPSIERLASVLIPNKHLLSTCTYSLNYGIRWYPVARSALQSFLLLELPAIHRTNAFLHVLVGHELFHPILNDFFEQHAPTVMARLRGSIQDLLARHPPRQPLPERRLDKLVELGRAIWQRALEEVMCDLGCAAIFGPPALFASLAFALGSDFDEPPSPAGQFYPPPRFRFRQVLRFAFHDWGGDQDVGGPVEAGDDAEKPLEKLCRVLNEKQFEWAVDVLRKQFGIIKKEVTKDTDLRAIHKEPLVEIAYGEVSQSLPSAWDYVQEKIDATGVAWAVAIDEIPQLLSKLEMLVPPGEISLESDPLGGRSASLSAIAIAMWVHHLRDEIPAAGLSLDDLLKDYHRECRLMLKAFEDVELRREYDSRRMNRDNP